MKGPVAVFISVLYILTTIPLLGQSKKAFIESWSDEENNSTYTLVYSGQKIATGKVIKGLRHGEWVFNFVNGKPRAEGLFNKGQFYGEWTFYDKSGTVTHTYNVENRELDVLVFSEFVSESEFWLFEEPFTDVLDVEPQALVSIPFHELFTIQKPEALMGQRNITVDIEVNCVIEENGATRDCIFERPVPAEMKIEVLRLIDQSPVIYFPGIYKGLPVVAKTRVMKFKVQFQ